MRAVRLFVLALLCAPLAVWAQYKVVFQVSEADPAKWNLTLNNVRNAIQEVGADKIEVEIVAYGPGIGRLKMESSAGARIQDMLRQRVKIVACENTMANAKLSKTDMLPDIGYVPSGVVELMRVQKEGWAYIRP